MAIVSFPSNPSIGDQYNENGVTYTWSGAAWTANGAENTDARYVQLTGDTMTGNLNALSVNNHTPKNYIDNSDFYIWNRPTNEVVSTGWTGQSGYFAARFRTNSSSNGMRLTNNSGVSLPAGARAGVQLETARFWQGVCWENSNTNNWGYWPFELGQTWTFSYFEKRESGSTTDEAIRLSYRDSVNSGTGQISPISGENGSDEIPVDGSIDVGNGWVRYYKTFTIDVLPSDEHICLAIGGPTPTGPVNFTGVALTLGSTLYPWQPTDMMEENQRANRCFMSPQGGRQYFPSYDNDATSRALSIRFPERMRVTPTVSGTLSTGNIGGTQYFNTWGGSIMAGNIPAQTSCYGTNLSFDAEP